MLRFSALLKKPWTGLQSYWKNQSQESDYDESIAKLCIFGSNNSLWEKRKKKVFVIIRRQTFPMCQQHDWENRS